MNRVLLSVSLTAFSLVACVSGAPDLTPEQDQKVSTLGIFRPGDTPKRAFTPVAEVSAADCSGAPAGGRVWGDAEKSIETLKKKAVAMQADAVVEVRCGAAPLLNNCWAAQKCTGQAIKYQ